MGKRKRGRKSATLSQEEIWDDSELQEAWNDAVEEYQQYHSIQAKGEDVEDVLRDAEASEAASGPHEEEDEEMTHEADFEPSVEEPDATNASKGNGRSRESQFEDGPAKRVRIQEAPAGSSADVGQNGAPTAGLSAIPRTVLRSEPDEALKNLMMSWYYAGYYTGLYEGQQRANRQS